MSPLPSGLVQDRVSGTAAELLPDEAPYGTALIKSVPAPSLPVPLLWGPPQWIHPCYLGSSCSGLVTASIGPLSSPPALIS